MKKIIYNTCRYCGKTAPFSDDAMKELGQEWYDRWNIELNKINDSFDELLKKVMVLRPEDRKMALVAMIGGRLDEAAKKAAGIE